MNVKLAYVIYNTDTDTYVSPTQDVKGFYTKKAAQMYDRLLKEAYGEDKVLSRIIYDDGE